MKRFALCVIASTLIGGCAAAGEAFDTVALQRWGHGAHDWLLPHSLGGKNDERDRNPRR